MNNKFIYTNHSDNFNFNFNLQSETHLLTPEQ